MSEVTRFSVSLEPELLEQFDRFCTEGRYATRSEAVRQLIREKLTTVAWAKDANDVAASLTLVFDHHKSNLTERMLEIQHNHTEMIVASMHVHLNHDLCMDVIAFRGPAREMQELAAELSGLKGIYQAQLVIAQANIGKPSHTHKPHKHHHH